MDSQMKRIILEMCMIYQFINEDYCCYEIIKRMKHYFPDIKDSTFYAILCRINSEGYTETYYESESDEPQKKYYKITKQGKSYFNDTLQELRVLNSIIRESVTIRISESGNAI